MTALSPERIAELEHWCSMPVDTRCAETLRALRDERDRLLVEAQELRSRCDHAASHENITCIKCGEEL